MRALNSNFYPIQIIPTMKFLSIIYKFLFLNYLNFKNNEIEFKTHFNWNNTQYNQLLSDNLTLCDIMFMLITMPLRYSIEKSYYILLADVTEQFHLYIQDEYNLCNNKTDNIIKYVNNLEEISKVLTKFKHAYSKDMDLLLKNEEKMIKENNKERKQIEEVLNKTI